MQLSKQEAQLLLGAVDVAIKAGGLQVAGQLMQVATSLSGFIQAEEPTPEPPKEEDAEV